MMLGFGDMFRFKINGMSLYVPGSKWLIGITNYVLEDDVYVYLDRNEACRTNWHLVLTRCGVREFYVFDGHIKDYVEKL